MKAQRALAVAGMVALVAAGGALGLAGCSGSDQPSAEKTSAEAGQALAPPAASGPTQFHATGLSLAPQPPAYAVRETPEGFTVEPANARHLRTPWSVSLRLAQEDPAAGGDSEVKKLDEREARYRLTVDDEGGSGGPLHTLTAWTACGTSRIVMTATQQWEGPGAPDWSSAWGILAASNCEARR